jgi:hypothetical protein
VNDPRTARGSTAKIPKAVGGEKKAKRLSAPKVTRDWIGELVDRGEYQE